MFASRNTTHRPSGSFRRTVSVYPDRRIDILLGFGVFALPAVFLDHSLKDRIDLVDVFHDLFRRASLDAQITNDQQKWRHAIQASNRFPTHRFIDVKQNSLPTLKSRGFHNRFPQNLPGSLEIREDSLSISALFCGKSHLGYQSHKINIVGWVDPVGRCSGSATPIVFARLEKTDTRVTVQNRPHPRPLP